MRLLQLSLNAKDQATVRSAVAFLEGRLQEKETIEWALSLGPDNILKRRGDSASAKHIGRDRDLREPWRSAWRLIEEFWDAPVLDFHGRLGVYNVQGRLRSGERSGALVAAMVDLVAPRLSIEAYGKWATSNSRYNLPKRPKKFHDLFQVRLTSGKIVDPAFLELQELTEREFLSFSGQCVRCRDYTRPGHCAAHRMERAISLS